jgi:peptide deformylase
MAIRPIVRLGHPALRTPAEPVDLKTLGEEEMQTLIEDMFETMREADGVGLAAPQLGIGLQLFVYLDIDPDADEGEEPEVKVLVNPALEPMAGELVYDWEGCLSIPDLRGLVPRHPGVRVHGYDRHGEVQKFVAEGWVSRILQHEYDHLNAIVFLDRMRDLRSLAFGEEWEEYMTTAEDDGDPAVG